MVSLTLSLPDSLCAIINDELLKQFNKELQSLYPEENEFEAWFVKLKLIEWLPLTFAGAVQVYQYMMAYNLLPHNDVILLNSHQNTFTPQTHQSEVPDHLLEAFARYKNYNPGWVTIYLRARRALQYAS